MSFPQAPEAPADPPAYLTAPGQPVPTGALSYGLGFLGFLPFPWLGLIVTGIVMAAVYPSQRRKGPLAAENARRAANWGLTIITVLVVLFLYVLIVAVAAGGRPVSPAVFTPLALYLVLGIAHLIIIIRGLIIANRGQLYVNQVAIPFLRAPAA